jgi:hypothetical protein
MDIREAVQSEVRELLGPGETVLGAFPILRPRPVDDEPPEPQRTLLVTTRRLLHTTLDVDILHSHEAHVVKHRSLLLNAVLGITWTAVPLRHRTDAGGREDLPGRSTLTVTTPVGELSWSLEGHDGALLAQRAMIAALDVAAPQG